MNTIIFASTRENAGKTSIIVGIANAVRESFGYIKPFGDRLIYRRKRNWDYDANLILNLMNVDEDPEGITLGFNHAKLRYVYDEEGTKKALADMAARAGGGKDVLFVESGRDLSYGASIRLDALSVARAIGGKLVVVLSGDGDAVLDAVRFLTKYVDTEGVRLAGVVVNKVKDVDDFESTHVKEIEAQGVPVLGVIPFREQLTWYTMGFLAERFFAKVIAGEGGIANAVKNIFVGAMSTSESLRNPVFNKESKLLITSGDRSDMILLALESDTTGIILTNNILPPSNIAAKASERNIPVLLVPMDTYEVAKQIDDMDALMTKDSAERIILLKHMAEKYLKLDELMRQG